jgi:hypothetical protein
MTATTTFAQPFLAFVMSCGGAANPSATSELMFGREPLSYLEYFRPKATTVTPLARETVSKTATTLGPADILASDIDRDTTAQEHIIGEFRRWKLLEAGWDGEGAEAPIASSLIEAIRFSRLLRANVIAEPMLFANGRAGLFWRDAGLYGDLEFVGDGRVAYFVERNGDKHKGVVNFDAKEMPALFQTLLPT